MKEESKINNTILEIEGMSTPKVRHLLNNLCEFNGCKYLEVGSFKGSTLCSAMFANKAIATVYEDRSEFQDSNISLQQLRDNINRFCEPNSVNLREENFFTSLDDNQYNVYFYDGIHRERYQYEAIRKVKNNMAKESIIIIDDFFCSVSKPKKNTFLALNNHNFYIKHYTELTRDQGFHGGIGVFVVDNL